MIFQYNNYLKYEISCEKQDGVVKNNIELDVKVKCIENDITQAQTAEDIQTTKLYVTRIIKKQGGVVNNTFIKMMETIGDDIELTYVKREVIGQLCLKREIRY